MKAINPYLNFPGTTEAAFNFYKSVFGGDFVNLQRFKDTPEGGKLSGEEANKLMHIALPLPDGSILMGTDALESMGHKFTAGNNFHMAIEVESEDEANKLFNALSAGGKSIVPLSKAFWGAYFGMFVDKFGLSWMINYSYPATK